MFSWEGHALAEPLFSRFQVLWRTHTRKTRPKQPSMRKFAHACNICPDKLPLGARLHLPQPRNQPTLTQMCPAVLRRMFPSLVCLRNGDSQLC